MKAAIIGFIVIVILAAGGFAVLHTSSDKSATSAPAASAKQTQTTKPSETKTEPNTITYSDSGFSPAELTVKAGTTVIVKNTASDEVQMDSDPHPVHTDDTDLNVGAVAPGESKQFTVTKVGSFGYHNHLNPGEQGKITIE